MKIHLSFDVEVWCDGWDRLDEVMPGHFERYVYGRSSRGEFALPATLDILRRNGLHGVFFVEPLFSARFGAGYLQTIVDLIRDAGQEVQLHIHPEWVDEIEPPVIPNHAVKRQHLCHYDLDEQTAVIAFGKQLLERAIGAPVTAFRAGSYAANRDTFEALRRNGIFIDSSMNGCFDVSGVDLRDAHSLFAPFVLSGVTSYPVTVFRDGLGRLRPAQVGACSFEEMRDAIGSAQRAGVSDFVIVSHNFELLKPGSSEPDMTVVRRFERLCAWLASQSDVLSVCGYDAPLASPSPSRAPMPVAGFGATTRRYVEQLQRRLG